MSAQKPKKVWLNGLNLSGLWFKHPRRATWIDDWSGWWDASGNFDAKELGQSGRAGGCVTFASEDRAVVESWTQGVRAAMEFLRVWAVHGDET